MSSSAFQCPLCQATVASQDELQLHYLTSCAGYDKVSGEQPHLPGGGTKMETPAATGTPPERAPPSATAAATASTATALDTCTVQFMWQPLTEMSYPRITLLASFEPGSVELSLESDGSYYASGHVTIPRGTYEGQLVIGDSFVHPVKEFTIEKDKDSVILQFQVASSGHDLTEYGGGQYGTGHMQSNPSYRYDDQGYQNYPATSSGYSYDINDTYPYGGRGRGYGVSGSSPTGRRHQSADTLQPTNDFEYYQQYPAGHEPRNSPVNQTPLQVSSDHTRPTITQETTHSHQPPSDVYSQQLTAEGFGPASVRRKGGSSAALPDSTRPLSSRTIVTGTELRSPSARMAGHSVAQSSELSTKATPQVVSVSGGRTPNLLNDINVPIESKVGHDAFNVGQLQQDMAMDYERQLLDVREQLESVTKERDTLLENRERVAAHWEGKTRRLERQLQEYQQGHQPTEDPNTARFLEDKVLELESEVESLKRQKERSKKQHSELKDQNAALQEQLSEYVGAINDQSKYIQGQYATSKAHDVELLQRQIHQAEFMKKQQLEYAESLGSTKKKIAGVEKILEENIRLNQLNVNLTGELEDYRTQTKRLLTDLQHKEDEITQLRQQVYESGSSESSRDRLELETMKQKCDAWREEVEKLAPIREEVEHLRTHIDELEERIRRLSADNEGLGKQLQAVVDDGEMKQGEMGRKASDYDTLMERFIELQQVRANLENELGPLREERAGILRESAVLREGAQPEKYARLKQEYASLGVQCEQLQEALQHEKDLVQRHLDTNVQLEQKLKEATNPDKLQSIRERMERYRQERDQARLQMEEAQRQAEMECQLQISEAQRAAEASEIRIAQLQNDLAELEIQESTLQAKAEENEEKMRRYRKERNQAMESKRAMEQEIQSLRDTIDQFVKQPVYESGSMDYPSPHHSGHPSSYRVPSASPPHRAEGFGDYERGYSPEKYEDPYPEREISPSIRSDKRRSSQKPDQRSSSSTSSLSKQRGLSSESILADVRTREGILQMYIQRPVEPLNPKYKPLVIVKRKNGEFETGSLMYTGVLDDMDMTGVQLDLPRSGVKSGTTHDGTFKDGRRHFKCERGYGLYAPLANVYVEIGGTTSTV